MELNRNEEQLYQALVNAPDVRSALHQYALACSVRDSICRKLSAGYAGVSVNGLNAWERNKAEAREALIQLADRNPLLRQHPLVVAATNCGRGL